MLTESFAGLFQPTNGLLNFREREILRSKRNYSPKTAGSRTEELPSHDVPSAVRSHLLLYVRFCGERPNEHDSPSPLGLKGRRRTPGTGCLEVVAGEQVFPWVEGQLAYQSGRKTASSCNRGTAPRSKLRLLLRNEMADVAVDASLNCLNPLTRTFSDML
jgi:hypothetical protein